MCVCVLTVGWDEVKISMQFEWLICTQCMACKVINSKQHWSVPRQLGSAKNESMTCHRTSTMESERLCVLVIIQFSHIIIVINASYKHTTMHNTWTQFQHHRPSQGRLSASLLLYSYSSSLNSLSCGDSWIACSQEDKTCLLPLGMRNSWQYTFSSSMVIL